MTNSKKSKQLKKQFVLDIFQAITMGVFMIFAGAEMVYAQTDPTTEISNIIERIVTIATQVGSAVMTLFIIKNAFEMMSGNDIEKRGKLARDIFFLLIASVFLFKPDFVLNAIKFITNA
jgi:hypothetical protein